ncbi:MAG TPA: class I SAM-dependent methyltransferase [Terrimicrobiaceae bacterium]
MTPALQAAARYRQWPNLYYYARGKIALDPVYPFLARALRDSTHHLLDLGCGMGLLEAFLRANGYRAPVLGFDIDEKKIAIAQKVFADDQARFCTADAINFPNHSGDVVMLDVLHYFSNEDQVRLLQKIAASIAPEGVAFIRLALNEPTWRFAATKLEEWFVHFSRWIPLQGWNFPTREEVVQPFRKQGLRCNISPMWGVTPFNSYLFTVRRT